MHIKIQGGGDGKYANQGSCHSLVNYLQHEDLKRENDGEKIEPFFSHTEEVAAHKIIELIDNNKKKLCRDEAKFFMITYSPSKEELKHLGNSSNGQSEKIKDFVRNGLMQTYAENFKKGLNAEDLLYFAKIHHSRKTSEDDQNLHVHVLVSRKSVDGRLKISPQTNHRNTQQGAVKGGFIRTEFYKNAENSFDKQFLYLRKKEEQFEFKNELKKADFSETKLLVDEKIKFNNAQSTSVGVFETTARSEGLNNKQVNSLLNGGEVQNSLGSYSALLNADNQINLKYTPNPELKNLQNFMGIGSDVEEDENYKKRQRLKGRGR